MRPDLATDPTLQGLRDNILSVIRGKDDRVDLLLAALLAGEHVLTEDLPGVRNATLAKSLAMNIDGAFRRTQFTPGLFSARPVGNNQAQLGTPQVHS